MNRILMPAAMLISLLVIAGCAGGHAVVSRGTTAMFPATYIGVLPCADCPGIRYHLNLFADNIFYLRMTYLERPAAGDYDDIGTWALSADGRTLILKGAGEGRELFAVKGPQTLRKLDLEGREIESSLTYDLDLAPTFAAFEPRLSMRGMYVYFADAGRFTECLTGKQVPVAMEADNAALERAYSEARHEPGEAVLVNLEGRLAPRPRMEGEGTELSLVVDRFIAIELGSCPPRFAPGAKE